MSARAPYRKACVHTALFEIGQAVKACELETLALEEGISDWILSDGVESLPIEQLQRLDYLRQMQADLSTALLYISRNESGMENADLRDFEIDGLLDNLSLGEVKERLLRATSAYQDRSSMEPSTVHHSSDVLFFLGD